MKKQLTFLCALLFLMAGTVTGQHYQVPNNNFENWGSGSMPIPSNWYTFTSSDCQLGG